MPDFDVVVIGAGSAGCAAASVLASREGTSVCLVEAGRDYGPFEKRKWPKELLDPRRKPTTHDWGFLDSRAKVVGGCSAHNQCAAVWGLPEDYDLWERVGCHGWSYSAIAGLIQEVERCEPQYLTEWRGKDGALPTRPYLDEELASWQTAFLESALTAGFPRIRDLSAPEPSEGVMPFHANVYKSRRWNAAFAFLDRVRGRENLTIFPNTLADRLSFKGRKALTLVCRSGSGIIELGAKVFVVCTGAYVSPCLLMRSGVGPPLELDKMGVPVVWDLPGVGANLQNHPMVVAEFELSKKGEEALEQDSRNGSFHESQVLLRAKSTRCEGPFDLHLAPYQTAGKSGETVSGVLVAGMVPKSRGSVSPGGADPGVPPLVRFGFLTDPMDRDASVLFDGVLIARRIAQSGPLAKIIRGGEPFAVGTREQVQSYIRSHVDGYSHPVGTCRMGPPSDPMAVVDSEGLVRGTSNVYVADASIMPSIPRANTNLTCMLIGLKIGKDVSLKLQK